MELKHVSLADSAAIAVAASNHSLTELHALILEALIIHKGSAHVDQICDHVSLTWGSLRKRDGTPYAVDCRRAVNSSLLKSCNDAPLYKRQHFHNWVLTTHAKAVLAESEVDLSDVKFVSLGNGQDQFKMPDDELSPYEPPSRPESAAGQNTPADNVVASDRIRDDTYEWPRVESEVEHDTENDLAAAMDLTGLQLILLRVLGTIEEGKGMHIEDIHYRVGPHFVNLKKKNGTMYSAETKRATISSLTNNPSPPFFVKINKDPTKWILAPAGLEKLALYKVQAVKMRARKRSQSDSNNEEPDTKSDVESETSKVDAPTKVNTKATGHTENKADAIRRSTSPTSDTPSKRQRKT
ncbi:hypothetical protein SARC_00760 [Sphaeroforma arctica JP610]|uniref:Uncharacterized protein n=1 Tax=Sphaeroforma arctica JP610 TaxID=667725 RepID=A0A0L0GDX0_9EUKA|nr:hypothetical protein SARC_00760 [Sphaeroforma arctica JP610]KNC87084.1 hypothetical protein SARC_00760 [Sphaeroforma arctica JP610]|eukprot:XP_014160986.1 hypothetical protein SARC_00760 [Sphaeroforma arctica JP610]